MANETPVSLLNQLCTQNDLTPEYNLIAREGRVHAPVFTYQVTLLEISEEGSGQSKKKAKHIAARQMLKRIRTWDQFALEPKDKQLIDRCLARCDEEDLAEGLQIAKAIQAKAAAQEAIQDGRAVENSGQKPMSASSLSSTEIGDDSNPIGKLQEICMKKYWHPPVYEDVGERGLPHERQFQVVCVIENMDLRQTGIGKSKKLAKRAAAQEMITKLRKENLDKVDELLDRLPRSNKQNGSGSPFDLVSEMLNLKKYRESTANKGPNEAHHFARFYADIQANIEAMLALQGILASDPRRVIMQYIDADTIIPDVAKLAVRIEVLLGLSLIIVTYPEKRDDYWQCIGEFITNDEKYEAVSVATSFGVDADLEQAKLKTMSRCVVALLMMIF